MSQRIDMAEMKAFAASMLPPGRPSEDGLFIGECILIAAVVLADAIERASL